MNKTLKKSLILVVLIPIFLLLVRHAFRPEVGKNPVRVIQTETPTTYPTFVQTLIADSRTGKIQSFSYQDQTYYMVTSLSQLQGSVGSRPTIYTSTGETVQGCSDGGPQYQGPMCVVSMQATKTLVWHTSQPTPNDY